MKAIRLASALFFFAVFSDAGAQEKKLQRLNFSYPSLTKTRVALWIGKDDGIFSRRSIASSTRDGLRPAEPKKPSIPCRAISSTICSEPIPAAIAPET
jgi:hypothetical protein